MKEVKKTGHSKNNNNATKKKPVNKKFDNEAPRVTKIESPVKEAKVVNLDNDFDDENDQKLIVVIAIALLVIIATVVGLLVGCERKEEEEPEEPKDDIVVPVEKDEKPEKVEEPVKKTTTKVEEKEDEEDSDVEVVIPMYDVTYYYGLTGERTHHESVYEGNSANEYVPQGYSTCKYYVDENYETEYSFDNLFEDSNIYLDCETIKYSVVYRFDENDTTNNELNPLEFTVEDDIELKDLETTEIFMGWYLNNEDDKYTNRVYALNRDLIKHADSENVVYLYAKVAHEAIIKLYDEEGVENVLTEVLYKETSVEYSLPSAANLNVCSTESKFLGWTSVLGSKNVEYKDEAVLTVDNDYTLYAVCGAATIQYVSNGETVTIAYTQDELNEWVENSDVSLTDAEVPTAGLPNPTDEVLGMKAPSYYVPVTEDVLDSLKIVSDDELELAENEVYIKDVIGNTRVEYTPSVGDRVQAFEKEFVGWIEKTEEVETPENEENVETEGTDNSTEDSVVEEGTGSEEETTDTNEGEVTEEELDFVTEEEIVEKVENGETEIELEAVWEIPEEDPVQEEVVEPEVEVIPEEEAPIA